ncbi:MAG: two-component regulator propeller domain-containing protein [Flavobacteriaceae bacterium]
MFVQTVMPKGDKNIESLNANLLSHRENHRGYLRVLSLTILTVLAVLANGVGQNLKKLQIDGHTFNLRVNAILEDTYGFLWFGTNDGLYRYDGHEVVVYQYDVFDNTSIPNNKVNSIVEDENKNLWIGCGNSLAFYDRKKNRFRNYYNPNGALVFENSMHMSSVTVYTQNKRFVTIHAVDGHGIDSIHMDVYSVQDKKEDVLPNFRKNHNSATDSFGRKWYGTRKGLLSLDENYQIAKTSFKKRVDVLLPFTSNSFLIGSGQNLYVVMYRKEDKTLQILEEYNKPWLKNIRAITLDKNKNEIWVGTSTGLFKGERNNNTFDFRKIEHNSEDVDLPEKHLINALEIDDFGNLWVGTTKGVFSIRSQALAFDHYVLSNHRSMIKNLFMDKYDNVWAGLSSGHLCKIDSGQQTCLRPGGRNKPINFVVYDYNHEEILVGLEKKLLLSQGFGSSPNQVSFKVLKTYSKPINCIMPISSNELWVGLWEGGIDIINNSVGHNRFRKALMQKLSGVLISAMHIDKNQILWIGTRGRGLFRVDLIKEETQHFLPSKNKGLSSISILCFLENQQSDELFIGTRGGGLNVLNTKTKEFRVFGEKEGLPSSTVASMQFDLNNNIWLSTLHGLSMFDQKRKNFVNFNSNDNITENEFVYGASLRYGNTGELLFGHPNGIYNVKTEGFKQKQQKATTAITKFVILGHTQDQERNLVLSGYNSLQELPNREIELPSHANNITIEFTSLDLTSPNKNKYAYKLEGVNDYWVHTSADNRNATYSDLKYGSYQFLVKSSNSDGVWNDVPASIRFTIVPPLWKSDLAYSIYALLLVGLMYISTLLIRRWYRLKKSLVEEKINHLREMELNKEKMVFFTDISHELRTPLTLIQGTMEKAVRFGEHKLSFTALKRVYSHSLRMKRLIDQIMDIRKMNVYGFKLKVTENNLSQDVKSIKNAFDDFALTHNIKYTVEEEHTISKAWYDVDVLEKVLYNLLSNAFKNSHMDGKVEVRLNKRVINNSKKSNNELPQGEYVECSVWDNGAGISETDMKYVFERYYQSDSHSNHRNSGSGIGMELVHKLIGKHKGKIVVKSEKNTFTEFTFWLPIEKKFYSDDEVFQISNHGRSSLESVNEPNPEIELEAALDDVEWINTNNTSKHKILIVEDHLEQRKMLKEELVLNFCVIEAENGTDGYELAVKEQPKLIISDIYMPDGNGLELLEKVKKNSVTSHIPILMLTGRNERKTKMNCIVLGAEDYIEKPYSMEFVKWKIHNILWTRALIREKFKEPITINPSEPTTDSADEKFIQNLVGIIENNMDDSLLSVAFLAKQIGMSRTSLYRKLQAIVQETPVNFIKKIKLKRACQLLEKENLYISEIAYMTGFRDRNYFAKCFSKAYHMSPTQYAKRKKKPKRPYKIMNQTA